MKEEITCTRSKLACKIAGIVLIILALWFYLAFNRHMIWPGKCTGLTMKIEKGEVVATTSLGNENIALTVTFPDQKVTKVILYNYCSGKVLGSVEAGK